MTPLVSPSETTEPPAAYRETVANVVAALGIDIERGLNDDEARSRLERYGPNELAAEKPVPAWRRHPPSPMPTHTTGQASS